MIVEIVWNNQWCVVLLAGKHPRGRWRCRGAFRCARQSGHKLSRLRSIRKSAVNSWQARAQLSHFSGAPSTMRHQAKRCPSPVHFVSRGHDVQSAGRCLHERLALGSRHDAARNHARVPHQSLRRIGRSAYAHVAASRQSPEPLSPQRWIRRRAVIGSQ